MINIIFKYNNEEFKVNANERETLLECAVRNNVPLTYIALISNK